MCPVVLNYIRILLFNPSEMYQNPLIKLTIWLIYVSAQNMQRYSLFACSNTSSVMMCPNITFLNIFYMLTSLCQTKLLLRLGKLFNNYISYPDRPDITAYLDTMM